ncbi:calmodulin-like protein 30 [Lotus japonicus]|uniref:calmodulin-like protein 30 n=1 Tax=Lotus japonicus TaxID=34305 RepID=UPI00258B4FCE|nr:calmodulin-like protein 30 [Lotus japonicus]
MSRLSFLKFQGSFSGKPTSPRKNQPRKNSFNSRQTSTAGLNFCPNKDEMKWVFGKFDSNKDGKISLQEYKEAARALDRGVGETEAAKTFKVMDSDGDGFIDFIEFMEMFNGDQGSRIKEEEIKSAFQVFDFNGDGKISAEELLRVLKSLGESCSLSACKKMVKGVDGNGDGFIDLNEFMRMMMSGKKLA